MKFIKPFLFISLLTVILSCSKDSTPTFNIDRIDRKIKYDDEITLTTTKVDGNIDWSSSNEYVGKIESSGKFVAKHIGETTVTAKWKGTSATINIQVEPYILGINEPYMQFGANIATIKSFEKRVLKSETNTSLNYSDPSKYVNSAIYLFENNAYASCGLLFNSSPSSIAEDVAKFFLERYNIVGENNNVYYFTDRDNKVLVGLTVHSQLGLIGLYQVNTLNNISSTKSEIFPGLEGKSKIHSLEKYIQK